MARIILKHDQPQLFPANYFASEQGLKSVQGLEQISARSFRSTCASMLLSCAFLSGALACDPWIVQTRLGISHWQLEHYRRLVRFTEQGTPFLTCPTNIFVSFGGNKFEVSKNSNLWDIFLLHDYIKRNIASFHSDEEKQKFLQVIVSEARLYQSKFERDHRAYAVSF